MLDDDDSVSEYIFSFIPNFGEKALVPMFVNYGTHRSKMSMWKPEQPHSSVKGSKTFLDVN